MQLCTVIGNFPRINGEHNTAGHNAFYFLQKSKVDEIPFSINKAITEDIIASDTFKLGYCVTNRLIVDDDPIIKSAGPKWPIKITGIVPVNKPEYVHLFEQMSHLEFIVVVKDNNQRLKLFGTKEKGLKFIYKSIEGGFEYEFKGEFSTAPSFYFGNLQIDSTVISGGSYSPGITYTVGGYWIFGVENPPSNSIGKSGDGYFNYTTFKVYEKVGNAWIERGYLGPDQELEEYAYCMASLAITGNLI